MRKFIAKLEMSFRHWNLSYIVWTPSIFTANTKSYFRIGIEFLCFDISIEYNKEK